MWGQVATDDGFHVMAYDVPGHTFYDSGDKPFFLYLRGETADEVTMLWEQDLAGLDLDDGDVVVVGERWDSTESGTQLASWVTGETDLRKPTSRRVGPFSRF